MGGGKGSFARYDRIAVSFHWLSATLVALAYFSIEMRGSHTDPHRSWWIGAHVWIGTVLWLVSLARLAWRLWRGAPARAAETVIYARLSRIVHGLLYAFVLVQPILGMLIYNLDGKPIPLAGYPWPIHLVGPVPALWHRVKEIHEFIGNAFYGVIGLHACAALYHHLCRGDGTMRRMSFG